MSTDKPAQQTIRTVIDEVLSTDDRSGLFRPDVLAAANELAGGYGEAGAGPGRRDPAVLATLAEFHALHAHAGTGGTRTVHRYAAVLLGVLVAQADPYRLPFPVHAEAREAARQLGADLHEIDPGPVALATVSAATAGADLRTLVAAVRSAAPVPAVQRLVQLVALAVGLDPSDLAPDLAAEMLARPPGPELADQGLALCQRYEDTGRLRDLTEGIELVRRAMEYAVDPEWRARNEGNLGTALHRLHEHTHAPEALDESIERFRSATACPVLNEYDRTFWLHDLAHALRDRYAQRSVRADLDAAIEAGAAILAGEFRPDPNTWGAWLSDFAADLELRLGLDRNPAAGLVDADRVVELRRAALGSVSPHYPDLAGLHANVGTSLLNRAQVAADAGAGDPAADVAEAVGELRTAAATMPAGHPYAVTITAGLARALTEHARHTGDRGHLAEAVAAARDGVRVARPDQAAAAAAVLAATLAEASEPR